MKVQVAEINQIADGQMKMVIAGDKEILLARVGESIFATQNRCPHMGGNLSHGHAFNGRWLPARGITLNLI